MHTDDPQFIESLKAGEDAAFRRLVETFKDKVYNTAIGILQDEEDAEDTAQEVFIAVYFSVSSFKGESSLSTWIYRITLTRSLDLLRKKKRRKRWGIMKRLLGAGDEAELKNLPSFHHPGVQLENKERSVVLFNALALLPESQRIAFTLHNVEGLSYLEISQVMNNSLSSVESLIHRAKQNLRKHLENYYKT